MERHRNQAFLSEQILGCIASVARFWRTGTQSFRNVHHFNSISPVFCIK